MSNISDTKTIVKFDMDGMLFQRVAPQRAVDHILRINRENRLDNPKGMNKDKSMQKIASVPTVLVELWAKELGLVGGFRALMHPDNDKFLRKKINEYHAFKTTSLVI